jgi:hypothetical protein
MSSLTYTERKDFESLLDMAGGHVANFSRRDLGEFVKDAISIDIFSEKYSKKGDSKANRLRTVWETEPDFLIGALMHKLCEHVACMETKQDAASHAINAKCLGIAQRLSSAKAQHPSLKEHARRLMAGNLEDQVIRLEKATDTDPSQTIGTAKDLIETTCRTILSERGVIVPRSPDFTWLTKETLKSLRLVPEGIEDARRGANIIKVTLSNLASVSKGVEELRNLYGTGHGKHGRAISLELRHAKLAAQASAAFCDFILNTHKGQTS